MQHEINVGGIWIPVSEKTWAKWLGARRSLGTGSFLDGVVQPAGCPLVCHDVNHNGAEGCGNPECWKHTGNRPPRPFRAAGCRCPRGTFPEDRKPRGRPRIKYAWNDEVRRDL